MSMILVINPGSTSTKVAVYSDDEQVWVENLSHSTEALSKYDSIAAQLPMRQELLLELLGKHGLAPKSFDAVAARGGLLCSLEAGAYRVNEEMLRMLRDFPRDQHASNLAAPLAYAIAQEAGIPAYIYDGVTVDEMIPLVRVTGIKEIERRGQGHNLNMRAAAIKYAADAGKPFDATNMIVVHLGGGISVSIISGGKIIDMTSDNDGPFAPERSGGLPCDQLADLITRNHMTQGQIMKKLRRAGGFMAHLGTTDVREVERMIADGDEHAALIYEAMALNVAKSVAKMAVVVCGKVDAIILTGGIAHSGMFTSLISKRVEFIAPVTIIPGENEMESLAKGVLRVLRGEEQAHTFTLPDRQKREA